MKTNITVRNDVAQFALRMEAKLEANDHKTGYDECSETYLFTRFLEESNELFSEINELGYRRPEVIANECADIANFCMMLATNVTRDQR